MSDEVMKLIKDKEVKYVDIRFTDPRGKWQHVTFDVTMIEEDTFAEGIMFDGSSIAGWKAIHESDMNLMPDPASACIDPFFAETTLVLTCDVLEGHLSSTLPHLGNISYLVGRALVFDGKTETFVDDKKADRLLTREYRRGFEIPSSLNTRSHEQARK